ncbi:MAG: sucrose-6-phosphate hydrolase [Solobacterium sp.]|nr:sucrose-6-phosphate hydrolase [Solobacterium sp.]
MKEWTREARYRVLNDASELKELHESIRKSPYRQLFHVQGVTGLINDPNGYVYHNGEWHLFYQWCPWGAVHGLKYWYHTVSEDLVTWKNRGIAIRPDTLYDNKGAYSGSALVAENSIYLYYTGNHRDENWKRTAYTCIVNMRDDGTYHKYSRPLFAAHEGYTEHQRDPKILYREEDGYYYIVLGAQTLDKRGCAILYRSREFNRNWEFAGELKVPGFENFGDMWECPSLERISGRDVLIFCPQHITLAGRGNDQNHNGYLIGEMNWDTLTFVPDGQFHVLDFGFDSYAAGCASNIGSRNLQDPSALTRDDKAILVAWMGLPDVAYPTDEEDWAGCLTLPRELTVRHRRLIQRPLEGLRSLRDGEADMKQQLLPEACEIELINRGEGLEFSLFTDECGEGGVHISLDYTTKQLTIDRSGMKQRFNTELGETRTRDLGHNLAHMRIYIDRSSFEIFVNDGDAVFTSRIFPTEGEHYWTVDGDVSIRIWKLKPAVPDDFVI